jgi:hypothetical protein
MIEPTKHDWPKIIEEIERHITRHKLCLMMHRHHTQVKRWAGGAEPRHYEGEMLLLIRAEYVSLSDASPQCEGQAEAGHQQV